MPISRISKQWQTWQTTRMYSCESFGIMHMLDSSRHMRLCLRKLMHILAQLQFQQTNMRWREQLMRTAISMCHARLEFAILPLSPWSSVRICCGDHQYYSTIWMYIPWYTWIYPPHTSLYLYIHGTHSDCLLMIRQTINTQLVVCALISTFSNPEESSLYRILLPLWP